MRMQLQQPVLTVKKYSIRDLLIFLSIDFPTNSLNIWLMQCLNRLKKCRKASNAGLLKILLPSPKIGEGVTK